MNGNETFIIFVTILAIWSIAKTYISKDKNEPK